MKQKKTIKKSVADYLRSKNANAKEVKEIITKCNNWLVNSKNKQIESIDKQISELQKMKESLM